MTFSNLGMPGAEIVPLPMIFDLTPSPKVTHPPLSRGVKSINKLLSPVMCFEQPLSTYHIFDFKAERAVNTTKAKTFSPSQDGDLFSTKFALVTSKTLRLS